jgi:hypothetical protein
MPADCQNQKRRKENETQENNTHKRKSPASSRPGFSGMGA